MRVEGNDRKSFFAVAQSDTGIDGFRFWDYPVELPDTCPEETNVYDMRLTQHEDGWIYGLFCSESKDSKKYETCFITYVIKQLKELLLKKLEEQNSIKLFNDIEMPLAEVLAKIQYEGMYIDKEELISFGEELKGGIQELTKEIYE